MDTITAVRNRILQLCGEREISINNTLSERTKFYVRNNRIKEGHCAEIRYIIRLAV